MAAATTRWLVNHATKAAKPLASALNRRVSHRGWPPVAPASRTVAVMCPLCTSSPRRAGMDNAQLIVHHRVASCLRGSGGGGTGPVGLEDSRPARARCVLPRVHGSRAGYDSGLGAEPAGSVWFRGWTSTTKHDDHWSRLRRYCAPPQPRRVCRISCPWGGRVKRGPERLVRAGRQVRDTKRLPVPRRCGTHTPVW